MSCNQSAPSWPEFSTIHTPAIADEKITRDEAVWSQEDGYLGLVAADPRTYVQ